MQRDYKILIIEDNRQQARYFEILLSRHEPPFFVDVASDAPEVFEKLAAAPFDAITIDYHLPSITGIELLTQIKQKYPYIPVIMVTGQGDERVAVEAMRKGAQDYITKTREYLELLPRTLIRAIRESMLTKQLEESRQRYYELFHNANIAIFVIDSETTHIQQMNKCAENLLGLDYDLGRQKAFFNLVTPDQQSIIERLFKNIKENGNATAENIRLLHHEKHVVPTDINGSYVQTNAHGLIELFVTDIREKLAMTRQLQLSQQRLMSLFNGITDLICVLSTDYKLLMGNKRYLEFTSNTNKSINNKKCYEALFNRNEPCSMCPALKTYESGDAHFIEMLHDNRIYHIWTFPMQSHDGRPEYIVEYAKDVTEDKEMERQLIKAEKLASIGLLSSGIAHELRNPLNIIETARYSIAASLNPLSPDINQKLSVIKSNVKRASGIIDNLLQFSRNSDVPKEQIDLAALIKSTVSLLYKEMSRLNIQALLAISETPRVYLNLDSLKQVFLNIIQNAIHAMPDGGQLRIKTLTSPDNSRVFVEFMDNGAGISSENLTHIFTPFFTTKAPNEGTGLGLYLSYTLLKREGGDIKVESTLGKGSTFRVQLPVAGG